MAVSGVDIVGPLPRELEPGTVFSAGLFAASPHRAEGQRLLAFLSSTEVAPRIRAFGLEPLTAG